MICIGTVKRYCKDYNNIENYDKAIADTTQTWHCHHRREISNDLSINDLIKLGAYWDVPASELIFLTKSEHLSLHSAGENNPLHKSGGHSEEARKRMSENHADVSGEKNPMYGKSHSEETRKKISESNKNFFKNGGTPWNKDKHLSEETKQKLSEALKGKPAPWNAHPCSEETRKKISNSLKGKPAPWNAHPHTEEEKQKMREGRAKYKHWKTVEGKRIWY